MLKDVMDHAVEVQREISKRPRLPESRRGIWLIVLLASATALAGYSWFARPEFIWGPKPTAEPARQEADTRFAMYLLSRRLEAHRKREGSYPATLAGIGRPNSSIAYHLLSESTFELVGMKGGKQIVLRSDMPAAAFLGNSPRTIMGSTR